MILDPDDPWRGAAAAAQDDYVNSLTSPVISGLPERPPPGDPWQNIMDMATRLDDDDRRRHEAWATHWRGQLDGATLAEVVRLWGIGELPRGVHIVMGPYARHRLRQRFHIQARLPGRWKPVGKALHRALTGTDLFNTLPIFHDPGLGGRWRVVTGPGPGGVLHGAEQEVIAQGWRLA